MSNCLQIPERISLSEKYISLHIHPEGSDKIKNYRATECDKGSVNEVEPDFAGGNVEFIAQIGTNTKGIRFNEPSESIHGT